MIRLYLLPIIVEDSMRQPKYNDQIGPWAMMDYGFTNYGLVATPQITQLQHDALVLNPDVYAFPGPLTLAADVGDPHLPELDVAVDDPAIDAFFEGTHIPTDWLTPATTYIELLRQTAGMFQFNQRYSGIYAQTIGGAGSIFDVVGLDDTYSDIPAPERAVFDATVEFFGYDPSLILPNQKLRQLIKSAGNFWADRSFSLGGISF